MSGITLSIIIPAYNEEHHLEACLDSIVAQSEMPDEVIVVDNNSTDKTAEIARSYKFVKLIREKRQGVVFARDKGFDTATSEVIGRIDADTILPAGWAGYVKRFYADKANAGSALTGGAYFYNFRFGHAAGWWQGQIAFRVNRLLLGHYILFGSNMALPAKLWRDVEPGVCRRNDIHEDLDLSIHLHRQSRDIVYHEGLKVGVKMRRVFEDRSELWGNLYLWPCTLRVHGLRTWMLGLLGAVLLYGLSALRTPFKLRTSNWLD